MPRKPEPSADAAATPQPKPRAKATPKATAPAKAPTPALPDLETALDRLDTDKLSATHAAIVDKILEVAHGIRVIVPRPKRQLKQGESYEGETVDAAGLTWHVYLQPPNPSLLRWAAEAVRGKAAAREATAQATSLVLKSCVPGHDAEINRYLASLPPDTLKRYEFDAATLAAIEAARE